MHAVEKMDMNFLIAILFLKVLMILMQCTKTDQKP